jgi:phage terminase small subunit
MKPPDHLKPDGAELWASIQKEYAVCDGAGLALLTAAAEALDRMRAAQAAIATHGEMVLDRYQQLKTNPACVLERDSRVGFLAALRQLNLDIEPLRDGPGRPPGR